MNVKNFIVGGIVGGVTDFLLGWLVYGLLLNDASDPNVGKENLGIIFGGCLCFGLLLSFVFSQGEGITTWMAGMKMGGVIAMFMSLWYGFFEKMYSETVDLKMMAMSAVVSLILGGIVGATVAIVNGKMK
ncbi:MAG: hypothetical protein KAX93_04300 [Flavobacterium sp.]|nr:hypothetical protein [Flavobacterium sp.]MBP8157577.1 hypothetical protein [Flavobacterium sp.]